MTAFSLFDYFDASGGNSQRTRLMTVASSMVTEAIEQFQKVTKLDEDLAPAQDDQDAPFDMKAARALRLMYEECTKHAQRVLVRIDRLEKLTGASVPLSEELRMWHGKTAAMLSVSPAEIAMGIEDLRAGRSVPGENIRDALRNRVRE